MVERRLRADSLVKAILDRGASPGDPVEALVDSARILQRELVRSRGRNEVYEILRDSGQYFSSARREYGSLATLARVTRRISEAISRDPRLGELDGREVGRCLWRGIIDYVSQSLQAVFDSCSSWDADRFLVVPQGSVAFSCYLGLRSAGRDVVLAHYHRPGEEAEELVIDSLFRSAEARRLPWIFSYQALDGDSILVFQAHLASPTGIVAPPGVTELVLEARARGARVKPVSLGSAFTAGGLPGEHVLPKLRIRTSWLDEETYGALELVGAPMLKGYRVTTEAGEVQLTPIKIRSLARNVANAIEEVILRYCR